MQYLKVLFFVSVLSLSQARADDPLVHPAAHIGMSYSISMLSYGFAHNAAHCSRTGSVVISVVTSLAVGALFKFGESTFPSDPSFGRAMLYNGVGTLGSVGTVYAFQF